jgi:GDP-L-fucose synthase
MAVNEALTGSGHPMLPASRVFVAGHRGLVGSAICRRLQTAGFSNLILRTRAELDLRNEQAVQSFFEEARPEYVFLAAAKVGGILANNSYPAEFIHDNLALQTNVIHAAWKHGVRKLLFLGSSCVYPRLAQQPIREDQLLTGSLEATNQWYAIAKIAGIKMAEAYRLQYGFNAISVMPTNLYGPGDNFDLQNSHVIPALLRKFSEALDIGSPEVVIWGSGEPRREFLHVDDLADAALFLMQNYDGRELVNVGLGKDVTIRELVGIIQRVTGFAGNVAFDSSKPDGTPRKLLDIGKVEALGWTPSIQLQDGIVETWNWYRGNRADVSN